MQERAEIRHGLSVQDCDPRGLGVADNPSRSNSSGCSPSLQTRTVRPELWSDSAKRCIAIGQMVTPPGCTRFQH